jgi:hypothetical protein
MREEATPMRIQFALLALFSLVLTSATRADQLGQDFADVHSLDDLQAVQPIHLANGWDIRVGIGEAGRNQQAWNVIYCLAHYSGEGEPKRFDGNYVGTPLGPTSLSVDWNDRNVADDLCAAAEGLPLARDCVFCARISLDQAGVCHVRARVDKSQIAWRDLTIKNATPSPWQQLVEGRFGPGDKALLTPAINTCMCLPCFDGVRPIPLPQDNSSAPTTAPAADALPAAVMDDLKLSLDGGDLILTSQHPGLTDQPHRNLLARWEVNGVAIAPRKGSYRDLKDENGRYIAPNLVNSVRVPLGLPADLGDLKSGDRVRLQVLCCPSRFEPVFDEKVAQLLEMSACSMPLISNWIEFTVTDAMLRDRAAATTQPTKRN